MNPDQPTAAEREQKDEDVGEKIEEKSVKHFIHHLNNNLQLSFSVPKG